MGHELLHHLWLRHIPVKKILWGYAKVFTNIQKFRHGRQCLAGRDALYIALAVSQIQTHLIFRNTLLGAKLGNSFTDKISIHTLITSLAYTLQCIPNKSVLFTIKLPFFIDLHRNNRYNIERNYRKQWKGRKISNAETNYIYDGCGYGDGTSWDIVYINLLCLCQWKAKPQKRI